MERVKMVPFFNKHTIMCGYVDYYCLVCESRFLHVDDTIKHIITDSHYQLLAKTLYESEDDGIRKIKLWYYCEFCSVVLKTKTNLRSHILEIQHVANKTNQFIKKYDNVIIAFDDVQIDNEAWDGFCNGKCILCNNEFEDVSEHLKDAMHNINFMQSNIKFNNKNIFRMVDESFHCLTCNSHEALPVTTHFDSIKHKNVYKEHQMIAAKIIKDHKAEEKTQPPNQHELQENFNIPKHTNEKNKQFLHQTNLQSQIGDRKINVSEFLDRTNNTKESVSHQETVKKSVPTKHNEDIKKNNKNIRHSIREEEENICKILNTKDYITKDVTGSTWCILCDWNINSDISKHINDIHHLTILKLHQLRINKLQKQENENNTTVKQTKRESSSELVLEQVHKAEAKLHLTDTKSRIFYALERFQNNDISINLEKMAVVCRKCFTTLEFDYKSIEEHISEHKEKSVKDHKESDSKISSSIMHLSKNSVSGQNTNHSKLLDSVEKNLKNDPHINYQTKTVSSKKCSTNINVDNNVIESHIVYHKGHKQKGKQESSTPPKNIAPKLNEDDAYAKANNLKVLPHQKLVSCEISEVGADDIKINNISTDIFIHSLVTVKNLIFHDHIINYDICINILSFVFITRKIAKKYKCLCCDLYLDHDELSLHINSRPHFDELNNIQVVLNIGDEFIRQLPSNRYHCGFCNILFNCWNDLTTHLRTMSHEHSKVSSKFRLQAYGKSINDSKGEMSFETRFSPKNILKLTYSNE